MVGLVHKRIAAFEEMAQMETVAVKQTPVGAKSVGKLISFFEHEVPTEVEEAAYNAQVVKPVDEEIYPPTSRSNSSSYWTARSHFYDSGFHDDDPCSRTFQNVGSQEVAPTDEEDEETRLRKSRFIFHVNSPATNIGAARARVQRGRRVPRAKLYLAKGMRILARAREARPASSPRKEGPQYSQHKKSAAKNTGGVRKLSNTDANTSVVTQPRGDNGVVKRTDLGVEAEDGRRTIFSLSRLRASGHGRNERTHSSQQGKVVRRLLRRLSSRRIASVPIEVNIPLLRDAIEPANSNAVTTFRLKVSLTRRRQ